MYYISTEICNNVNCPHYIENTTLSGGKCNLLHIKCQNIIHNHNGCPVPNKCSYRTVQILKEEERFLCTDSEKDCFSWNI